MTRTGPILTVAAAVALLAANIAHADVSSETFKIRKAQDLVDLCAADPSDPTNDDAINFCHGFAAGAWQYHEAQANGPNGHPIVCLPDPPPKRVDAIAQFVAWSRAHPQYMNDPAAEALFRFLVERWPCPDPAAKKGAKQ